MGKRHLLPVVESPGFETECYHNIRLSLLLAHARTLPWYHSHFMNLTLKSTGADLFPVVRFEEHLDVYSEVLEETPLVRCEDWVETARKNLGEGRYMIVYFNWRNIPCSRYYNKQDMFHEALVYGFDDERGVVHFLAFDVNGKGYGSSEVPYGLFGREMTRLADEDLHAQRWFAFYGFPASVIRLKDGLASRPDTRNMYFALERGRVRGNGSPDETFAMGHYVNEVLSVYFRQLAEGRPLQAKEFIYWNIIVHKMILHKSLMLQRIIYLQTGTDSSQLDLLKNLYIKAKTEMDRVKWTSIKYQRTKASVYLHQLADNFQTLYELEKRASAMLMEFLTLSHLK
ncbi:hypothetical protein ACWGPW_12650 [Paenibacillus chitinolyticus]